MRRLEHCNIVKLKYFFYSSGDKVTILSLKPSINFKQRWSFVCRTKIFKESVIPSRISSKKNNVKYTIDADVNHYTAID